MYNLGMAQLTNQDDFIKTALRLPRDVHARIQEAASAMGRSMNAEIVARLQASFQPGNTDLVMAAVVELLNEEKENLKKDLKFHLKELFQQNLQQWLVEQTRADASFPRKNT